jgi:putative copper export protein
MKQTAVASMFRSLLTFLVLFGLQFTLLGQDTTRSSTKTTTTTTTTTWYTQPWVWVVGAVVLLIIVIALTRGSNFPNDGKNNGRQRIIYSLRKAAGC